MTPPISKEALIILDNTESILDPREMGAKEIHSVVDELCQFKRLCICITSHITTVLPRCEHLQIHRTFLLYHHLMVILPHSDSLSLRWGHHLEESCGNYKGYTLPSRPWKALRINNRLAIGLPLPSDCGRSSPISPLPLPAFHQHEPAPP